MSIVKNIIFGSEHVLESDKQDFYDSFLEDGRFNIDLEYYHTREAGFGFRYREGDPVFFAQNVNIPEMEKQADGSYRMNTEELYRLWKRERGRRSGLRTGIL
jgi:hypothetical protein